ncbi:sulfotransferase domain-containing protein [Pleurocapsa sp. FMAR1]|uniref:sulfotransferase domain-containing protein n=1 Tax=Pleurocapsa sp. FMAR1 TaxID=3040204 RepID=UPI0029C81952|nr:sulfotransferase domain-containing protein [Pleurocapsa sp. FMAR1]
MSYLQEHQYLIIGGTTKAATTSLFNYLAVHPKICAATRKETRFFIDNNCLFPSPEIDWSQGLEKYNTFFKSQLDSEHIRLEASPDYLYSLGTPQRIKTSLPNTKVIFILREPISRLISWYRYAKQRAFIPKEMTFEEYVEKQFEQENSNLEEQSSIEPTEFIPQTHLFSKLKQGCYSNYLQPYLEIFGHDNVHIGFYEELCLSPRSVSKKICDFAGIDSAFYDEYKFEIFNQTKTMKNPKLHGAYERFRTNIRGYTYNLPIHVFLRQIRRQFDTLYYGLNTVSTDETVKIPAAIQKKLEKYYYQEKIILADLLARPIPW